MRPDKDAREGERKPQHEERSQTDASYLRPENEDDDGYDPYSDRPAPPEPLFERDPWN